jgi:hypothetical protein
LYSLPVPSKHNTSVRDFFPRGGTGALAGVVEGGLVVITEGEGSIVIAGGEGSVVIAEGEGSVVIAEELGQQEQRASVEIYEGCEG